MANRKRRAPAPAQGIAVGYTRVSTTEQLDGGVSLAQQRAAIEVYAAANGLTLSAIVEDGGVSASIPFVERDGGRRVVEMIEHGEVSAVVATRLDRAFRSSLDALAQTEAWTRRGCGVHFVSQKIDTSSAVGKLLLTMLSAVAEMERNLVAERTAAALRHLAQSGVVLGAEGLGWERIDERDPDGRLVVREVADEAETVARIHALRCSGYSLAAIAATLTREGRPSKRGGTWWPATVRQVLMRTSPPNTRAA